MEGQDDGVYPLGYKRVCMYPNGYIPTNISLQCLHTLPSCPLLCNVPCLFR